MKKRTYVAGHNGMLGSAIVRLFEQKELGDCVVTKSSSELDLRRQSDVECFFKQNDFTEVFLCAAVVGGIHANNSRPWDFISDNLAIQQNVISAAQSCGVKKLLFLGSSCIYPKHCSQPMRERDLLTGLLEKTNEPYAIAKIAGIKMCEAINRQFCDEGFDYRAVMPTNLYGKGDNYHPSDSHVLAALVRKFSIAKFRGLQTVSVWGSGSQKREFMHVDDAAKACLHVMNMSRKEFKKLALDDQCFLNVGSGEEVDIRTLSHLIARAVGFKGQIEFDSTKLEGVPRKLMNSEFVRRSGWNPERDLESSLTEVCDDYINSPSFSAEVGSHCDHD